MKWPGSGTPRKNFNPQLDGDYTVTRDCPHCGGSHSGHSNRSEAAAKTIAGRAVTACMNKKLAESEAADDDGE